MLQSTCGNCEVAVEDLANRYNRLVDCLLSLEEQRGCGGLVRLCCFPQFYSPILKNLFIAWNSSEVFRGILSELCYLLSKEVVLKLLLFPVLFNVSQLCDLLDEISELIKSLVLEWYLMLCSLLNKCCTECYRFVGQLANFGIDVGHLFDLLSNFLEYTAKFFDELCCAKNFIAESYRMLFEQPHFL